MCGELPIPSRFVETACLAGSQERTILRETPGGKQSVNDRQESVSCRGCRSILSTLERVMVSIIISSSRLRKGYRADLATFRSDGSLAIDRFRGVLIFSSYRFLLSALFFERSLIST
jgi:hypothetical protein